MRGGICASDLRLVVTHFRCGPNDSGLALVLGEVVELMCLTGAVIPWRDPRTVIPNPRCLNGVSFLQAF